MKVHSVSIRIGAVINKLYDNDFIFFAWERRGFTLVINYCHCIEFPTKAEDKFKIRTAVKN